MTGIAKRADGAGSSEQQIAAHEVRKAEVGMADDEAIDLVERCIHLLSLDFLEYQLDLRIGSIERRAVPGLAGMSAGRRNDENRGCEQ
jgi:hypothetical protein